MGGIVFPFSGKAAYGMLNDMAQNPKKWEGRKVLFVHTGGLLGLFDKVDQMAPRVKNWSRMDVMNLFRGKMVLGKCSRAKQNVISLN